MQTRGVGTWESMADKINMPDPIAIKQRLYRARSRAAENLRRAGYGIIETKGEPFDIIAVRYCDARFVRVTVGPISTGEMKRCRAVKVPENCVREVWSRKDETDNFEIKFVLR